VLWGTLLALLVDKALQVFGGYPVNSANPGGY